MTNSLITIVVIAVSLALDAVSASVAGGLKVKHTSTKDGLRVAAYFGAFQAGMPLIGWLIGGTFRSLVVSVSGLIAFILLSIIGLKMIKDSLTPDQESHDTRSFLSAQNLTMLAIATGIDALVVGVILSLVHLPLFLSVVVIGVVTFALSFFGFVLGKRLGSFFQGKIEILGGTALIGVGLKLLLG